MRAEKEIIWENLTEPQREIADIIGLDNYIKLIKHVNGDSIYIPQYSKLTMDEEIRQKFDGYNFKELAREYDLTVKTIYNKIPKTMRLTRRHRQVQGQISFENPD